MPGALNRRTTEKNKASSRLLSVQLPPGAPDYGFRYPHRGSGRGLAHVLRYLRRLYAVGIIATWFAKEPERADAVMHEKEREAPLWTLRGFFDAVVDRSSLSSRAHPARACDVGQCLPADSSCMILSRLTTSRVVAIGHRYVCKFCHQPRVILLAEAWPHPALVSGHFALSRVAAYATLAYSGHGHSLLRARHGRVTNFGISFAGVALSRTCRVPPIWDTPRRSMRF